MKGVVYDVIVVGGGVEGSYTAYHLAKQGKNTLVLEQFPLPHTRGSSHGQSRITRKAYTQTYYANMMLEAYPLWAQLEAETKTQLYKQTGLLVVGEVGGEELEHTGKALSSIKCLHEYLTPVQLATHYPMMTFGPTMGGLLDHEAGILHADRCLAKIQEAYQKYGGTLHDAEKVLNIQPGSVVTVETTKGQHRAKSIVITAGAWTGQVTKALGLSLPLQPECVTVSYWRQTSDPSVHGVGSMPAFILPKYINVKTRGKRDAYGLPASEYANHTKICVHGGALVDPDARDAAQEGMWQAEEMNRFVRVHFPGLEDKPSIMEKCIYTMTPDENFILDKHPTWKNIVIGAGFSGHGFKLAPVIGKILAELALGKTPSYNISPFKMDRFSRKAKL